MEWKRLLSENRIGKEARSSGKKDLRSEFEKDYHRIIVSASFRRLQDKTQVFPLDKSDFIRTRLTHSLEVSSIGRSLAQNIAAQIISARLDPDFTSEMGTAICDILQCAGLIHDIGNPPFGHFGEEAIREWFVRNLAGLKFRGRSAVSYMSPREIADLKAFEGNAQGLRMVTKLDYPVNRYGMNLTCGLLSAMIKYPTASDEADPSSKDVKRRKMGYFHAEEDLLHRIAAETGTEGKRNPLALILEAADDIAYATADIEDAFKKGFFRYAVFLSELHERGVSKGFISRLVDAYDLARLSGAADPEEYGIRSWLREMQEELLIAATDGFVRNYGAIMDGTYEGELIAGRPAAVLLRSLKQIAYDYAFTSMSIFKTEIAANNVLTYLLDILVPAALTFGTPLASGLMEEKYLSLISENYKQVFLRESGAAAKDSPDEHVYERILLATDTVSGMTDSYARDLYSELTGL